MSGEKHDCGCEGKAPRLPAPEVSRRDFLKLSQGAFLGAMLSGLPESLHAALPQPDPKRIYIAMDDHTDYMWAADEATYEQAFVNMIDYYLDYTDATAGNISDFQSRFNMDGSFWVWVYERNRTPAQVERLINRIRDGHFSVPMNALVCLHGGTPAEAVLRGLYYAGELQRRFNIVIPMAHMQENQTLPYGLSALWAGAGARFSWKGICNCVTQTPTPYDREHEIYWYTGPDGSRILMKWYSMYMFPGDQHLGGYAEARRPDAIVNFVDTDPAFIARYPYRVIGAFGYGWDDLESYTDIFVTAAQAQSTVDRRVIVSNEEDFFYDFEATYSATLPTVSASFGNEWELYVASMGEVSARVKRAMENLRAAEAMASMVTLYDATFMTGRDAARRQAWMALGLYWEHNWTANGAVPRAERADWQRRVLADVENYVNQLHTDATQTLGTMIPTSGIDTRFFAFNPLTWSRTDFVDFPYTGLTPIQVIDLKTGQETPSQIVTLNGQNFLRVLAHDIPAIGYKVFEIRTGAGQAFPDAATITGNVIDNGIYQITMADRGAILSLIQIATGREFARDINGRVMNDIGPGNGTLTVENIGAVSATIVATATGTLDHITRVTLYRDIDRIDIHNTITQNFGGTFMWGFGFNIDNPDLWHEEVGAIIRTRLLADGGHYSPRNARYDWLTLNHFADITGNDGVGMTLSNWDTYYMRYGNSDTTNLDTATPLILALAGGQVDGLGLGILDQDGDTEFTQRFALRPHTGFSATNAMRFALEHQNPLIGGTVTGTNPIYPETNYSFVTISSRDVFLWALKPPETSENGLVARTWNLSTIPQDYTLTFNNHTVNSATQMTHVEIPINVADSSGGNLHDVINGQQLRTYFLQITPGAVQATSTISTASILSKSANPPFALPGANVTWTIRISNLTAQMMNDIRVTDTLPGELQILSVDTTDGTVTRSGQSITFTHTALAPAENITVTIQTRIRETAIVPYVLTNSANLLVDGNFIADASATVLSVSTLPATGE